MGSHAENTLNSLASWSEDSKSLKDIASSKSGIPGIYKIVRGNYRTVGADKGNQHTVLIHSIESSQKILAETIKISGSKINRSEQKYSIPLTFQGWFEVLSEDGKSISTLSNVQDIARAMPHFCLVREDFRAPVSDSGVDDKLTVDRTRLVKTGEKLTLKNDILAAVKTAKGQINKRYLRCHDEQGQNVFLSFDENISLSPIAGQNNISGVHSIKGLLDRFRLPVTVKLAHGTVATKLDKNWTSMFKLINTYSEEVACVLPLKKDSVMIPVPIREPVQLLSIKNTSEVLKSPEFSSTLEKCNSFVKVYLNSIQPLHAAPDPEDLMQRKSTVRSKGLPRRESVIEEYDEEEEGLLFEEIEEIYRYVRDGGDPPPPKTRNSVAKTKTDTLPIPTEVKDDFVEPVSNYAYINDLKQAAPSAAVGAAALAVEEKVVHRHKRDTLDDDGEPLYADIAAIHKRKKNSPDRKTLESKIDDVKSSADNLISKSEATLEKKVDSSVTQKVEKIVPAMAVAPILSAAASSAGATDDSAAAKLQNSPAQILRNRKPGPPTPQRSSQIIPQSSAVLMSAPKLSDDGAAKRVSSVPEVVQAKTNEAATKVNRAEEKFNSMFESNVNSVESKVNGTIEKETKGAISGFTAPLIASTIDKVEDKASIVKSNLPAQVNNQNRSSLFTNNKAIDTKQEIKKPVVDPPKVIPIVSSAALAKKETEIRNAVKSPPPPPVTSAIARDFQVNKSAELKKDFGFAQPIKPVAAQQVRSANNLVKQEVPKVAYTIDNKVNEIKHEVTNVNNVIKDTPKINSKLDNIGKEVVTRSYEAVGNDRARVSSRTDDLHNDAIKAAPILADFSKNVQPSRNLVNAPVTAPMNPIQNINKEIKTTLDPVPNILNNIPHVNQQPVLANIVNEIPNVKKFTDTDKILHQTSTNSPSQGISNFSPVQGGIISTGNTEVNIQPIQAPVLYQSPSAFDQHSLNRPSQSSQPSQPTHPNTTTINYSSPQPLLDNRAPVQPARVDNFMSTPPQVIPEPLNYQTGIGYQVNSMSRRINPTSVTIGEGPSNNGNAVIGWQDENTRIQHPSGGFPDTGSTAVNISNGVAVPIERSVLQLSSSSNSQKVESSIVHTSGFDKLIQDEELARRNMLHIENQAPGKSFVHTSGDNQSFLGYNSQNNLGYNSQNNLGYNSPNSFNGNGVNMHQERTTVVAVSNTGNINGSRPAGYSTIRNNGSTQNGSSYVNGMSTINRQKSFDSAGGVSITTVHMSNPKAPDMGYRVPDPRSSGGQQSSGPGHTVLKISQQPQPQLGGGMARSGTTYAVSGTTLNRVK